MLRFVALGPMEIRNESHGATIKGVLQRTLLATFLASDGGLLTANDLIEELWGTTPPVRTENALHAQISRLRRTLARLEPDCKDSRLSRTGSGYQLSLQGAVFDGAILRDTVRAIRAKEGGYTRHDAEDLRAVLNLWRGPVFGVITGGLICQKAIVNFHEYRTAARILLYRCEIDRGESAMAIPELSAIVEELPFQESFCGLLMVALYRSGRQADALTVVRELRGRLIDELGIEPSPALRDLESAILNHDRRLLDESAMLSRMTSVSSHLDGTDADDPTGIAVARQSSRQSRAPAMDQVALRPSAITPGSEHGRRLRAIRA